MSFDVRMNRAASDRLHLVRTKKKGLIKKPIKCFKILNRLEGLNGRNLMGSRGALAGDETYLTAEQLTYSNLN